MGEFWIFGYRLFHSLGLYAMNYRPIYSLILTGMLSACATLPHSGPSAGTLLKADRSRFSVVNVTNEVAAEMASQQKAKQEEQVSQAVQKIVSWSKKNTSPRKIAPGSVVHMTLWYRELHLFTGSGLAKSLSVPLGTYRISDNGDVTLPYLGSVHLQGRTLPEADRLLSADYLKLGQFVDPYVEVKWANQGYQQGVLVSGDVRNPGYVPWISGGLSLAKILATSGLSKGTVHVSASAPTVDFPTWVSVYYRGHVARVPLQVVWSTDLSATPGERIVVQHKAETHITVLGGGVVHPGAYDFGNDVDVNRALAAAGGLSSATANDRVVFVLEQRTASKQRIYTLRWDDAQGLFAAGRFPMHNGETLYVPTAPVVPLTKAVQIFSGFMLPPALLANAVK